jgi:hypothetical protein
MDDNRETNSEAADWWSEVAPVRERIESRRAASAARRRSGVHASPERDAVIDDSLEAIAPEPDTDLPYTSRRRAYAASLEHGHQHREAIPTLPGTRRTVRIRGQAIPTLTAPALRLVDDERAVERRSAADPRPGGAPNRRRRPPPRPGALIGASPDRLALWAVVFAVMLIVVAAMSAH